jgi:hypothetical protein
MRNYPSPEELEETGRLKVPWDPKGGHGAEHQPEDKQKA